MRLPAQLRRPGATWFTLALVLLIGPPAARAALPQPSPASRPHAITLPDLPAPARTPAAPVRAARTEDGTWREVGLLQIQYPAAFVDPAGDRLHVVGGNRSGAWSLPLSGAHAWEAGVSAGASPWPISYNSAYDPGSGLVYFAIGGFLGMEMWTYDRSTGQRTRLAVAGAPPGLHISSVVFDPGDHRLILFGGQNTVGEPTNEVWALDLLPTPSWSRWTPTGTGPAPCEIAQMIFDARRNRVVVVAITPGPLDGVWALELDGPPAWVRLTTQTPLVSVAPPGVAYDAAGDRVLALADDGLVQSYALDTDEWTTLAPSNSGPEPRENAALAVDPTRHQLIVSGGYRANGTTLLDDTYALSLDGPPAWSTLVPPTPRPPVRGGSTSAYDAARHDLLFGGAGWDGYPSDDTWALSLDAEPAWSSVVTAGTTPPARQWSVNAFDPARDQMVVFGGRSGSGAPLGDLWTLGFASGTPTWTPVTPAGPAPAARFSAPLVYDANRDRFLMFFGTTDTQVLADVWELRLGAAPAWRLLHPSGAAPTARGAGMAAFDPIGDRVIVFGGGSSDSMFEQTWSLDLSAGDGAWSLVPAAGGPSGRALAAFALDEQHGRVLMFGGYGVFETIEATTYITYLDDAWALSLAGTPQWTRLAPDGPLPQPRDRASAAYDAAHDRFVIACGGISGMNDTWSLDFPGSVTAVELALAAQHVTADRVRLEWSGADPGTPATAYRRAPDGEWAALAALSADGVGSITLEDRDVTPGATLQYRLGIAGAAGEVFFGVATVHVPLASLRLAAAPVGERTSFTVTLPSGAPASLEVFDLAGRRVWSREVGPLGAGTHAVAMDDARLPSALYFARLQQGGAVCRTKVVLAR